MLADMINFSSYFEFTAGLRIFHILRLHIFLSILPYIAFMDVFLGLCLWWEFIKTCCKDSIPSPIRKLPISLNLLVRATGKSGKILWKTNQQGKLMKNLLQLANFVCEAEITATMLNPLEQEGWGINEEKMTTFLKPKLEHVYNCTIHDRSSVNTFDVCSTILICSYWRLGCGVAF